ncbi:unnamed protein product, partial [Dovyalis caffra]
AFEVKDEGINEAINEGIIKCDAIAIKVSDESDDFTIDFLGLDNSNRLPRYTYYQRDV